MPLNKQALKTSLSKFMDPDAEGFEGSPKNTEEFADKFSKAISSYVETISPPVLPNTLPPATAALKTALLGVGTRPNEQFPVVATAAMATFSAAIVLAMAAVPPQGSVVATPPPAPIGPLILTNVLPLGMANQPASVCVEALASTIDGWFKTGAAAVGGAAATPWV